MSFLWWETKKEKAEREEWVNDLLNYSNQQPKYVIDKLRER